LHDVFNFHKLSFVCWWWIVFYNWQQHLIQNTGFNFFGSVVIHFNSSFNSFKNTLFVQYRNENYRYIGKWLDLLSYNLFILIGGFVVFFNQIPFVHQYYYTFPVAFCQPKNILYLTIKTTSCVHDQQTYITMLNGTNTAHNRIKFQIVFDLGFSSYSSSIHQIEFKTKTVVFGIYGISCCASNVCNYIPIFTNKCVYKRRFSCIGSSNYSKSWQFVFFNMFLFR